ncbi:MAG: ABC-2 family transporter protein [Clostridia bacterium]|nr:ABC-2 family transporter protein [Clostridia bacterium]
MRQYLSFFRIRFIAGLQYRAAAWAGISTQFAWGFLSILMFKAFYETSPADFPMEFSALSSYIWLRQALLGLLMSWFMDGEILESVSSGSIAYELCRPTNIYAMWYAKNFAIRLSRATLRFFPIVIVAVFLPSPYGLYAPAGVLSFLLFTVSLFLGAGVLISFSMILYISTFYTVSPKGILALSASIVEFFSGAIIPIPFFPDAMGKVLNLLPFASIESTPYLIYTGYIPAEEALFSILLQVFWLTVLTGVGVIWLRRSLRRVVVQGG